MTDVPDQDEHREPESAEKALPAEPLTPSGALASRFNQMFPVLSPSEITRVRRFGEIRRFPAGEFLSRAGEPVPPMYVILSGRVAIVLRDALGQALPVAAVDRLRILEVRALPLGGLFHPLEPGTGRPAAEGGTTRNRNCSGDRRHPGGDEPPASPMRCPTRWFTRAILTAPSEKFRRSGGPPRTGCRGGRAPPESRPARASRR